MKWIRSFLLALLFSLLVGFAIGTWLRLRLERRPVYIGLDQRADGPWEVAFASLNVSGPPTPARALRHDGSRAGRGRRADPTAG